MPVYIMRHGKIIEKSKACRIENKSAYVISDEMAETRHMADNKRYTSKAKFRRATREAGCVEVGNELATLTRPRAHGTMPTREQRRAQIRDAVRRQLHGVSY